MTRNVTSGDDKIMNDGQPRNASHEGHDGFAGGAPFVNYVDYCLVIAKNRNPFLFPEMTPDVAGYGNGENLMQSGGMLGSEKLGRPVSSEPLALKKPSKIHGWSRIREKLRGVG